nr:complex I NDUFA9 subunit family protein [Massilia sp. IC2-476]
MRAQNVVVIGGTGFIGGHLVARLAEEGVGTVVPARHYEAAKGLTTLPYLDLEVADIHDDATLRRLLAGRDAVINLVGVLNGGHGEPYGPGFRRLHVELPRRIVQACAELGVPRYLHMSALGASPTGASMYQRSKADGELAARSDPRVAATIFRPSIVFGPGDHFLTVFARLQRHLPVLPLACAQARIQPVYVEDVAAAFALACANRARAALRSSWAGRRSTPWPSWCSWPAAMPATNATCCPCRTGPHGWRPGCSSCCRATRSSRATTSPP